MDEWRSDEILQWSINVDGVPIQLQQHWGILSHTVHLITFWPVVLNVERIILSNKDTVKLNDSTKRYKMVLFIVKYTKFYTLVYTMFKKLYKNKSISKTRH